MNYLDIIFIVPLLWAAYRGFSKGLIIEVSTLIAFGLGIWGGIHLSNYIADILVDKIDPEYVALVSFAVTFILIVAAIFVLGKMLEKVVNIVQLKLVNKITGAAFGVAKVALIISVILVIINSYDQKASIVPKDLKEGSLLYQPLTDISLQVIPALEESKLFPADKIPVLSDSTDIEIVQN